MTRITSFIAWVAVAMAAQGAVYHVRPDGDDAASGLDWANARRTIQAAVNLATLTGDEVVVTNGVYAPITSTGNRSIVIRSVEGAAATIIDGGGANRCATLGVSTGNTNTVLAGFTLRNGRSAQGGGVYGGTLHDCVLTGNVAENDGGGSNYSVLFNCLLIGNTSGASGGGSYYGTLYGCTLSGNVTRGNGGGAYQGVLNNCVVTGNRAANGGGTHTATLNGCTVSGNAAADNGGGTHSGTINNSVVWGNASVYTATTNYSGGTFRFTCTAPSTGSSPVNGDPLFRLPEAGDFRLLAGSPCLDKGSASYIFGTTDVLGNTRVQNTLVDLGAYEGTGTLRAGATVTGLNATAGRLDGIRVSWAAPSAAGPGDVMRYRVFRLSGVTGAWVPLTGWIAEEAFLDVNVSAEGAHDYAVAAAFDAGMDEISGMSAPVSGHRAIAYFVDASQADDSGDGRSWGTAKKTLQAAIDLAVSGETIAVTNGVYAPITATGKALAIQSVNGARATIIDGGGTNRCATLGTTTAPTSVSLRGFTLRNGRTAVSSAHGGGVWGGTLHDCIITGNTVAANTSTHGGGAYYSVLNNCIVSGNTASGNGGGAYYGLLNNCVVSENVATVSGGGTHSATLNNCTVAGNRATGTSTSDSGGTYSGTLNNCIVWGNTASGTVTNYSSGTFRYTCTAPLPSGTANLMANPLFRFPEAGDFRLTALSPCMNRGTNALVVGTTDVLGNPRIQGAFVNLGAYEGAASTLVGTPVANLAASTDDGDGIAVTWDALGGATLYRVLRLNAAGQWVAASGWMTETAFFDAGVMAFEAHTYAVVAAFDENLDDLSVMSATVTGQRAATYYVDASRPDDTGDGKSWAAAKKTIQAAVALAVAGETIVVTNGVYAPITGSQNKAITIRSINGAEVTIIDGGGINRCATLATTTTHTSTILDGFTLRNGSANVGGGVYGGTLYDCLITGNTATGTSTSEGGGGAYYSVLHRCTLSGNIAANRGGGAHYGTLHGCLLIGNRAANDGGGANYATLHDCVLTGNTSWISGGGSHYGTLNGCTLSGNTTVGNGGGAFQGRLNNCVVTGNRAANGGGTHTATLHNCTVSGNMATDNGGGTHAGTMNSCIVWENFLASGNATTNYNLGTFHTTCTAPTPTGTGNLTADPLFRLPDAGDFRLLAGSQCLDKAFASHVTGSTDVLGNPRVQNASADLGAYEGIGTLRAVDVVTNLTATTGLREGIRLAWDALDGAARYRVVRLNEETGLWMPISAWMAETGFLDAGMAVLDERTYAVVAAFDAGMGEISGASASATGKRGLSWYVDAEQADDSGDGRSWATAKKTIQAAVAEVVQGEVIAVTNGVYGPISTVNKTITIQSVNGARFTVIDGGGTNRCATLGSAFGHTNVVLTGFTLTNGRVADHGGGAYYGTLNDCILTGNATTSGTGDGGGAYYSILNRCILKGNTARYGGGACYGTLNNCVVSENVAVTGGGVYSTSTYITTLNNCTVVGNRVTGTIGGGGTYLGMMNNSIVWGNTGSGTFTNYNGGTFRYSCAAPLPSGGSHVMNIAQDPLFRAPELTGDYRLMAGTPCLDAGTNFYVVGTVDLAGNPRIQGMFVDMGAYEGVWALEDTVATNLTATADHRDGITVSWDALDGAAFYRVLRRDEATGQWVPVSDWIAETHFLDTGMASYTGFTYSVMTAFDGRLNDISIPSESVTGQRGTVWFVDAAQADDSGDGHTWGSAKRTIQAAVALVSVDGEGIEVMDGTYEPFTATGKMVSIRSVNGAGATAIDGGGTNRCVTFSTSSGTGPISTGNTLTGFTLTNGFVTGSGSAGSGGGVFGGTLDDCVIAGNWANSTGGGAYRSVLTRCTVSGNESYNHGGGAGDSTLNHCTVTGNTARSYGGGARDSTLNHCTVTANVAMWGGGAYHCSLGNCLVTGNRASYGAGVNCTGTGGTLRNCTISGNSAAIEGGGVIAPPYGTVYNCIIEYNTVDRPLNLTIESPNFGDDPRTIHYSLMSHITPGGFGFGLGNIFEQDPLFRFPEIGDYRLMAGSPCLDRGLDSEAAGSTDLAGNPRIQNGRVDMGAYEGAYGFSGATVENLTATTDLTEGINMTWDAPQGARAYRVVRMNAATGKWAPLTEWMTETQFLDTGMWPRTDFTYGVVAAFDEQRDEISLATVTGRRLPTVFHVDETRPDDNGDGMTWNTAKQTIQAAIALATGGDEIAVTNGVYAPITVTDKALAIYSAEGASKTSIDGNGTERCATLGTWETTYSGTTLRGFTLTNGWADNGGGALYGILEDCILSGNTATGDGGGAAYSTLNRCTVSGNTAEGYGGGADESTLSNCLISGNTANYGGGASFGTLVNCTVADNTADNGGGVLYSTAYNSIVWGNAIISGTGTNHHGSTFHASCTAPLPSGADNIMANPLFADPLGGDYRLQQSSSCVNAGNNADAVGELDLDGNDRIRNGLVDMGAYESPWAGTAPTHTTTTGVPVPYTWLDDYLGWKSITDYEDLGNLPGANGLFFWESYVAGLIPTDPTSKFLITNFVVNAQSRVTALDWTPRRTDRVYTIYGKTNLLDSWFTPTNSGTRFFKVEVKLE